MRIFDYITPAHSAYSPIGLDLGATSVKMAQFKRTVTGWRIGDMRRKDIPLADNERGTDRKDAIIQTIKEIIKMSSFSGRSVVSVMPAYQLDIFPVRLSTAANESMEDAVLQEARAHLSYDVKNAVIDYLPFINSETGPNEEAARSLLMAARREDVDEHLSILKAAKLKPLAVDISACALARLIEFSGADNGKNEILINAGELHTTITVLRHNNILFDRSILWGSENIVESLMNRLKLEQQEAAALLHRVGMSFRNGKETQPEIVGHDYRNKVSETVYEIAAPQLEQLAREIDRVIQYFSSEMRGADIDTLYLSGTVSPIKGLDTYLGNRTGIKTQYFDPLRTIKAGKHEASKYNNGYASSFSVALGLALRGHDNQPIMTER